MADILRGADHVGWREDGSGQQCAGFLQLLSGQRRLIEKNTMMMSVEKSQKGMNGSKIGCLQRESRIRLVI